MTEDISEKIPLSIPSFPKLFYEKCKLAQKDQKEKQDKNKGTVKGFDLKVSFLIIRENERVDLIIEYFNQKLKKINKDQLLSTQHPYSDGFEPGSQIYETNSTHAVKSEAAISSHNLQPQLNNVEKDFVFDYRTFKEVFPYISSVDISENSNIEEAYKVCVKKHITQNKKKLQFLSNIPVIQFHKNSYERKYENDEIVDEKTWDNFFTYILVPFNDKNVNSDIANMAEIIGRAMEKKSETKVFD